MFRCIRCGNTLPGPGQLCEQCQELERQEKGLGAPAPSVQSSQPSTAATPAASFCASCGSALPVGAGFCQNCGHQIGAAVSTTGIAGMEYAGFWIRFLAQIIDSLILLVPSVIINLAVPGFGGRLLLAILVGAVYRIGFWVAADGATPGKMAMGIRIVTVDGGPIEPGTAFLRYIGYFASAFTLGIGYLMIAFSKEKRGLHDQIAGTIVVRARS